MRYVLRATMDIPMKHVWHVLVRKQTKTLLADVMYRRRTLLATARKATLVPFVTNARKASSAIHKIPMDTARAAIATMKAL